MEFISLKVITETRTCSKKFNPYEWQPLRKRINDRQNTD